MVVASLEPVIEERTETLTVPVIDLSWRRERSSELIVKACEEFGMFKVVNHGVPKDAVAMMEAKSTEFFSSPMHEKQRAGPPNPLGYGAKNIGFNGDVGELEYLLLHSNPTLVLQKAKSICSHEPNEFSEAVNEYVESVRELTCEILEMLAEGMGLKDKKALSRFISDSENDSLLRLNHYPPCHNDNKFSSKDKDSGRHGRVGFGEHSDPQILTVLWSNRVAGLQMVAPSPEGKVWVPVPPDPTAFYVIVGDILQAMTNGRLVSVRHKAMANSDSTRLSMIYFGAPPLNARISPLPETVTVQSPRKYKSFTWGEFKKAMYSLRLGYNRLDLYRLDDDREMQDLDSLKQ